MTFALEVIREIRRIVEQYARSPFLVGYRLSPEEPETPGITMPDTLRFMDVLAGQQLDYLHISLNDFWSKPRRGVERQLIPHRNHDGSLCGERDSDIATTISDGNQARLAIPDSLWHSIMSSKGWFPVV